jgi:restriction endonuclease Mrr
MPIPDFQQFMLPILELAADGKEHTQADVLPMLIQRFNLTHEAVQEKLPSGATTRLTNRAHWARIHMTRAGLLESPKRGVFRITDRGRKVLEQKPKQIDNKYLKQFPEFLDFIKPSTFQERGRGGREGTGSQDATRAAGRVVPNPNKEPGAGVTSAGEEELSRFLRATGRRPARRDGLWRQAQ